MRRDHRPYYLKNAYVKFQEFYVNHFLRPQFDALGKNFNFMQPWNVEVFGPYIHLGDNINVMASKDNKVRFSVWTDHEDVEGIFVGNACLICPGSRISAAKKITIGDGTMLAAGAYVTDADWHGLYDRRSTGVADPVTIGKNAWVGDSSIVTKGVTIGDNSIIGARSIVLHDIPDNVVAAGNPAQIVKELDPDGPFFSRADWYADPVKLQADLEKIDRDILRGNTFFHWLRYLFFPRKGD